MSHAETRDALDIRLADVALSLRVFRSLDNEGMVTLRDLVARSGPELLRIPFFGRKALREVEELLGHYGLRLPGHYPPVLRPVPVDEVLERLVRMEGLLQAILARLP